MASKYVNRFPIFRAKNGVKIGLILMPFIALKIGNRLEIIKTVKKSNPCAYVVFVLFSYNLLVLSI